MIYKTYNLISSYNRKEKDMNESSDSIKIPFFITLIGSILLLIMILLPYASSKDYYKEY